MVTAPEVRAWGKGSLTAFEPTGERAAFLDQRMRSELAKSLRHILGQAEGRLGAAEQALEAFLPRLESGAVPPLAFSFYSDAVLAIEEGDTQEAAGLLSQMAGMPRHPGGPIVTALGDPKMDATAQRYVRLIDTDPTFPFEVFAPEAEAFDKCRRTIAEAFALMEKGDPGQAAESRGILREIILAAGSTEPTAMTFDGASSFMMWGGIVLNVNRGDCPVAMAQMIVHEGTHNFMFGMCTEEALIENADDELYSSPLRPDARPMDGIYHATFVTARMHRVVKRLLDSGILTEAQREIARKDLAENARLYANGIETVRKHARMTTLGRELIEGAEEYMRREG